VCVCAPRDPHTQLRGERRDVSGEASPNNHFFLCRLEVAIRPSPKIPNTVGEDSKSTLRKHLSWQYIINAAVIASANPTANCNMNQFFLSITRGPKSSPEVSDY